MAYIGRGTENISNVEVLDNLTFNGSASYTLQKSSTNFVPSSANNLLISISGVVQQGNFSVSGSTITFDTTVSASDTCDWILHYGTGLITTVADGAITEAKLGSNAVTTAKINNGAITSAKLDSGLALGKIGQQVHGTSSTEITDSSGAFIDTGLTVNITPSSTSSKINLIGAMAIRMDGTGGTDNGMKIRFMRDSTSIWEGNGNQIYLYTGGTYAEINFQWTQAIIDEPSTTSQITYKIQTERSGDTQYKVMFNSKPGYIIAQEVLA